MKNEFARSNVSLDARESDVEAGRLNEFSSSSGVPAAMIPEAAFRHLVWIEARGTLALKRNAGTIRGFAVPRV